MSSKKNKDRMVTFSRHQKEIHTKLNELSLLCGADVGFLVISSTGKPYTFGNPSFEAVAKRFLNDEGSSLLQQDAEHKMKMEELYKVYNSLVEKVAEEEKKLMMAKAEAEALPVESNAWWKIDPAEVKEEKVAKQLLEKYEELYEKLQKEIAARNHGGDVP
ncbi:unnamed protein product [Arabidopsis arenosa]|uniref:MADS-box domain-containing protein n=1 Tax=Arabidopsis arenosa TaxID=38785 RepID=A0A8S2AHC1_ARAAE|nr:unnamed protein product [Arabidopsis arenosa]